MSTHILAIDPGPAESAYVVVDAATRRPLDFDKTGNERLLHELPEFPPALVAIEMVASYGMPVGREVFDTCVWVGRIHQAALEYGIGPVRLVYRLPVKLHHCGSARAKDSNVVQALVDRFAAGVRNHGKGTKADPGWFHGFRADVWQAYALAVFAADTLVDAADAQAVPS